MALSRLAELHGVATSYSPSPDRTVPAAESAVVAALAALGVDASSPEAIRAALEKAEAGQADRLLPPTVVLRSAAPSADPRTAPELAALPPGTRVRLTRDPDPVPARPAPAGGRDAGEAVRRAAPVGEAPPPAWNWTVPLVPAATAPPPPAGSALPPAADVLWAVPFGVHRIEATTPDGRTATSHLVIAPDHIRGPESRAWGLLVQLYSLLSHRSWGMGDLGDLAELATWAGRVHGAGFVQVNPLHAAVPGTPTDPSPYRPSSRRFPDPVHLRVEAIPEYTALSADVRPHLDGLLRRAAELRVRVLSGEALIDRDAVWELKREALERLCAVPLPPGRQAAYEDFTAAHGQALTDHATWAALTERHGPHWSEWPAPLTDPRSRQTAAARTELAARVDFHRRLAWYTDTQLAEAQRAAREAGMAVGLVHDLAVGVHPDGSDAWSQQDVFAAGMSVGAPPDAFNALGQDWGLPPWRPDRLAESGYAPYRGLLRSLLRNAGALRIDHVMGLFRLWWVPVGAPPTDGTYVHYDAEAMLAVLALEAHRADAVVIGEDLGTVEPGVRETLQRHGVLGTSVLWFERDWDGTGLPLPAEAWRASCVATATTHDLPSTASRLTGDHVRLRHRLGLLTRPLAEEEAEEAAATATWLTVLDGLGLMGAAPGGHLPGAAPDEEAAVLAVHRFLLRTPARMIGVWLPDGTGDRRPQNLPGTWDQYPNWRLPVADAQGHPVTLEQLTASPRVARLLRTVATEDQTPAPMVRTAPPDARPV
ncbi:MULTISPECIES: 4-alpha-glucanotransferase [Streptomyces]|uniref:4-alpha-glucanotransferase n=2 Tax=Streptomyces TaxID=1883 RepID=A0A8G2E130_9ACTN|nr:MULTISPECIES: 4-alpha-glucanotransferase [Streptomyces]RZE18836.1 4-alpha-glucanotransferase [Streptomyces albidoflavus]RZE51818.1 4-alpha-glucanotransferase [Streptomyces albidoflavus]RZE72592.1 4-alpha-glucanotransferase [Streptomyces albidoflavus]WQG73806.1 4-alpha-glucanotransferase [Streptomyces albidoflavus]WSU17682.1 4-alpha-glucanotransferase [Streptomyces albidoflavus]